LRGALERLLSGSAPTDPLYLSNRSLGQRIGSWSLVAVPCLVLVGLVALVLSNYFDPPEAAPPKEMSAEEVARKVLPNLAKDIKIESNREIEVVEVHVDRSGQMALTGTVKNNTSRRIAAADVVFNVTDTAGSQLGAVNGRIENLAPKSAKEFRLPIKQPDAVFALVREVSTSH